MQPPGQPGAGLRAGWQVSEQAVDEGWCGHRLEDLQLMRKLVIRRGTVTGSTGSARTRCA
jgi:hypothetical protein